MVGSSGDSGRDRTGTCSGADANGRTVPHMVCRLEKPIFDCFPHTGRGVGRLTRGEVERTMGIEPAFSAPGADPGRFLLLIAEPRARSGVPGRVPSGGR
jgi:hypothetical protein